MLQINKCYKVQNITTIRSFQQSLNSVAQQYKNKQTIQDSYYRIPDTVKDDVTFSLIQQGAFQKQKPAKLGTFSHKATIFSTGYNIVP